MADERRVGGRDLCLIADRPTFGATRLLAVLPDVLAVAGRRAIVIDRGDCGDDEGFTTRLAHLTQLLSLCAAPPPGALLMVSARVDLALAAGADGVQLLSWACRPGSVRATFPRLLVGRSCHERAGLERSGGRGRDWALLSPGGAARRRPRQPLDDQTTGRGHV